MPKRPPLGETGVLLLLSAVHFVNLVDFMMVMPMGPDFASALGIPMNHLGFVGGSYTWAAFLVGLAGAKLLDRFPRRAALTAAATGLGVSTAAAAFAPNLLALLAARACAGACGGLAGTLCFSIVVDMVPEERRAKAMAIVSGGYGVASIVGVPLGLELARRGGWRAPFLIVGGCILALALAVRLALPPLAAHLESTEPELPLAFDAPLVLSFAAFGLAILGNFLLIPNLSAFIQFNLGFPRAELGWLYFAGGLVSLFGMWLAGVWTDRSGSLPCVAAASVVTAASLYLGVHEPALIHPILFYGLFMSANAARWVSIYALAAKLPPPRARGRFLSAQTAAGHAFCSIGSFGSTRFLTELPGGRLLGMERLALAAIVMGLAVPFVVRRLETLAPARP